MERSGGPLTVLTTWPEIMVCPDVGGHAKATDWVVFAVVA